MIRTHRNLTGRGRRALCWAAALFVAAQLGAGLLLDYVWPLVRFRSLADTLDALREQPRSPDILCLGSSRMGTAFREQTIEESLRELVLDDGVRVFNAALEGSDLITADFTLAHILAAGVRPAVVVLEVSPETLAARNRWMRHNIFRQWTWGDVLTHAGELASSGGTRQLMETRLLPLYTYRHKILAEIYRAIHPDADRRASSERCVLPNQERPPNTGVWWEAYMAQARSEAMPALERTRTRLPLFRDWVRNYRLGGTPAEALARLIQRCNAAGCKVILLGVPLCEDHRRLYAPAVEAAFQSHMDRLSQAYGCTFVDARGQVPDELFQDNIHVLLEGGRVFSRQFAQRILAPVWRTQVATMQGNHAR